MRASLLLFALAFPSPALAAKGLLKRDKAAKAEAEAEVQAADAPALEPVDGSLWNYIEQIEGTVPADEAVAPSEELDDERSAEREFLIGSLRSGDGTVDFYKDPVGATDADPLHLRSIDPSEFDIPVVVNDDVIRWMKYFTGSGRKYYSRWLERSTRYRPMMYEKLDAAGMPRDLVYLSMIESGYATHAYSRAAAVGLWQFITPTATEWGMRVDWWVDDRRDPEMSTEAAIRFLGYLNKKFGHWYLAWAAYNGGPSRVQRAVDRHGTKDFWTLVKNNAFPEETDNYVPKLIAAAIIGKHPERYGFTGIEYQDRMAYDTVEVGPNVGIDVLARCAGLSQEDFQELNPHLRRWSLPPDGDKYLIRVPVDQGETFLAALDKVPPSERLSYRRYKVQRGDTLGVIAARHGVTVDDIQRFNRISNANKIVVGMDLVIPTAGSTGAPPPTGLASTAPAAKSPAAARPAARSTALASTAGASGAPAPKSNKVSHTVQRGEALSAIAERYGVSQSDLLRWNSISNANKILAGQKLVVYEPASRWTSYTVRSGDSLGVIAQRNGCSVSELKSWNNLGSSTIHPGQRLKVRKG